jgi:hypothetical protein
MKRFKIALAALLVTGGIVAAFAFTSKSAHKPFTTTTFYYVTGTCDQLIPSGTTGQTDCKKNSLVKLVFKNANNWTTASNVASFANATYIAALTFNMETASDGGDDGEISISEALNGVWTYYENNSFTLPDDGQTITVLGVSVTIRRKSDVV